jgi:hypothetical protein
MTNINALIEPSFADAIAAIEAASELPDHRRQHWVCSLRQIARAIDRPLVLVPARWTSARFAIGRLHHVPLGWTAKTLANHKANMRAALMWFCQEQHIPTRGAPLNPEWQKLRGRLADFRRRSRLSSLMRYCSAHDIPPHAVNEAVIDAFLDYRANTTALATDAAARRSIARAWNGCVGTIAGWPCQRLIEPATKATARPAWQEFPSGLRHDIARYLEGMRQVRRSTTGKRLRPCKPTTIRTRRAELVAVARMAVRCGVPIETLISLGALVDPSVVETVFNAYWTKNGEEPRSYTIDLSWKLLALARETGCLDGAGLEKLDDMRANLEHHRRTGLTDKNMALVRQVLTEGVWTSVVSLPVTLMAKARAQRDHAPIKAAVTAQIAVAIAILSVAPVRLSNLGSIRLGENLIRPAGPDRPYWLVFPNYDVKNRMPLEFPLDPSLSKLIDEYVHEFRPALMRGSNEPWLFPGQRGGFKIPHSFSEQISQRIEAATGLRVTVHQFRHAAGAIVLRHHPGNYELVRRLLGHRNIQTAIRFYCGLEMVQASEMFGEIIREQLNPSLEDA